MNRLSAVRHSGPLPVSSRLINHYLFLFTSPEPRLIDLPQASWFLYHSGRNLISTQLPFSSPVYHSLPTQQCLRPSNGSPLSRTSFRVRTLHPPGRNCWPKTLTMSYVKLLYFHRLAAPWLTSLRSGNNSCCSNPAHKGEERWS